MTSDTMLCQGQTETGFSMPSWPSWRCTFGIDLLLHGAWPYSSEV